MNRFFVFLILKDKIWMYEFFLRMESKYKNLEDGISIRIVKKQDAKNQIANNQVVMIISWKRKNHLSITFLLIFFRFYKKRNYIVDQCYLYSCKSSLLESWRSKLFVNRISISFYFFQNFWFDEIQSTMN